MNLDVSAVSAKIQEFQPMPIKDTAAELKRADNSAKIAQQEQQPQKNDAHKIKKFVDDVNKQLKMVDTRISLTFDNDIQQGIFRIIETSSGRVLRQIPGEDFVRFAKHVSEILGALIDKKL